MSNVQNAITALNALTADELQSLIPTFNTILRAKRAMKTAAVVEKIGGFNHGDILSWVSQKRGRAGQRYYLKFEHMNRAGTCVQGKPCDENGKTWPGYGNSTVGVTYIDRVNGQPVKKAA